MAGELKKIALSLISIICLFTCPVFAVELNLPLPYDAAKISEKILDSGIRESLVTRYESSWSKKKLQEYYKAQLKRTGWRDEGNDTYVKDGNIVTFQIRSKRSGKGKTSFIVITSSLPTRQDFSASRKKNPDKLKFMPIYPGSEQLRLWELPNINSITGIYRAEGSVREVVFFYKSRMLNYGWALSSERLVKGRANLIFTKAQNDVTEKCEIKIAESQPGRVVIFATYNEHKKIFKYKK